MKGNIELDRRKVLGTVGGLAMAGSGMAFFSSGNAAATNVSISAGNPDKVMNDRGDLSRVTVDPNFHVQWDGMDQAVGKVFCLIEAKVDGGEWSPIFRMTPWLTEDAANTSGLDVSSPGTKGKYYMQSVTLRDLLGRALVVADENGRPDYDSANWSNYASATHDTYMSGVSMGSASDAESFLVDDEGLVLQNNFPDGNSGYYGAAANTSAFDDDRDGKKHGTWVELRYTFALQTVNQSMLNATGGTLGTGWYSDVQETVQDSQGNSALVMNGQDGYPDITNHGAGSPAATDYDALQSIAGNHPAVVTETAKFKVMVENEQAESGATGDSNTGAS